MVGLLVIEVFTALSTQEGYTVSCNIALVQVAFYAIWPEN